MNGLFTQGPIVMSSWTNAPSIVGVSLIGLLDGVTLEVKKALGSKCGGGICKDKRKVCSFAEAFHSLAEAAAN